MSKVVPPVTSRFGQQVIGTGFGRVRWASARGVDGGRVGDPNTRGDRPRPCSPGPVAAVTGEPTDFDQNTPRAIWGRWRRKRSDGRHGSGDNQPGDVVCGGVAWR